MSDGAGAGMGGQAITALQAQLDASLARERELLAELNQCRDEYRVLFESSEIGMYRSWLDGSGIISLNQALADIFGYSREELLGSPANMCWADPVAREEMVRQLKVNGELRSHEIDIINKQGERRTILASIRLYPEQGYLDGTALDITELRRSQDALRERVKELRCLQNLGKVIENAGTDVEALLSGVVLILPDAWQFPEQTEARIVFDKQVFQSGDPSGFPVVMARQIICGGRIRGEVMVGYREEVFPDRTTSFLQEEEELLDAVCDRLGHAIERMEIQDAVSRDMDALKAVFDGIEDVIYVADPETYELLHVNSAFKRQWPRESYLGEKCYEVIQGRDEPCSFCTNDKIFGENQGKTFVWEFRNHSNRRWYRCLDKGIAWLDGRMVRFELASDITERKLMEEELRQHHDHLEELVALRTAELDRANVELLREIRGKEKAQAEVARNARISAAVNRIFKEDLRTGSEEELAQAALKIAEDLTGSEFGFVGLLNKDGKLDTLGISNPGWAACTIPGTSATKLIRGMPVRGIWGQVIKHGTPIIENNPEDCPERVGTPTGHPQLSCFLGVPLVRQGVTVGLIALANRAGGFDSEQLEVAKALAVALQEVLQRKLVEKEVALQVRIMQGQTELASFLIGDQTVESIGRAVITYLCEWLNAPVGLCHVSGEDGMFHPTAGFAMDPDPSTSRRYRLGEGLVGQAAMLGHELLLQDLPETFFNIRSGLGEMRPGSLLVWPVVQDREAVAVLEFGLLGPLGEVDRQFLTMVSDTIAFALKGARARAIQARLFRDLQRLNDDLQAQQEELRAANEELEEQTRRLRESEQRMEVQQEELTVSNEELEEKNNLLERQKQAVEQARREIAAKAEELALASRYKSEFLANMSHELRTPLNSLLLLSRALADNRSGNMTSEQVECAEVVHQSGNDLLSLINEILDLSKIEAGRLEMSFDKVRLDDLVMSVNSMFQYVAAQKHLDFTIEIEPSAPMEILSDRKRLEQVLKNLIGNAIKFTDKGSVRVVIGPVPPEVRFTRPDLVPGNALRIEVGDTGIGISEDQQKIIFEAFQQANGATNRKYGGTGLGLSISRELTRLLGGEIQLASELGRGSVFTVFLPHARSAWEQPRPVRQEVARERVPVEVKVPLAVGDDREQVEKGENLILVVEDDPKFASALVKQCHDKGLKVLAAGSGEEGIELAGRFLPRGIILDLKLPGVDGWKVLEVLKSSPHTRHIPIHIMSVDEPGPRAMRNGAIGYIQKPATREQIEVALDRISEASVRKVKTVLVVEDDKEVRKGIVDLIAEESVRVHEVGGGEAAILALHNGKYDCMILDLSLRDVDGEELLQRISRDPEIEVPPVIVYTGRELSWEQQLELRSYSDSIIIKDVRSDERLLDEVSLFLHRVVSEMPEQKRRVISNLHDTNALLRDKTVLLVDDDMRALFALSRILNERGMRVLKAENGLKALEVLREEPAVDLVLMDIMMPVMDGYETMQKIRAQEQFSKLPVIALTAKAMKGDQERCIKAGASDYLPKPIDQDRLLSMLRVWLYK